MKDRANIIAAGIPGLGSKIVNNDWETLKCFDGEICHSGHNCGGFCDKARRLAKAKVKKIFPQSNIEMPTGGPVERRILVVPVHTYTKISGGYRRVNMGKITVHHPEGVAVIYS